MDREAMLEAKKEKKKKKKKKLEWKGKPRLKRSSMMGKVWGLGFGV